MSVYFRVGEGCYFAISGLYPAVQIPQPPICFELKSLRLPSQTVHNNSVPGAILIPPAKYQLEKFPLVLEWQLFKRMTGGELPSRDFVHK